MVFLVPVIVLASCFANAIPTTSSSALAIASAVSSTVNVDANNDTSSAVGTGSRVSFSQTLGHSSTSSSVLGFNQNMTVPHNPRNEFDACDGTAGYSPFLYHNYTSADCVPIKKLDANGIDCSYTKYPLAGPGKDNVRIPFLINLAIQSSLQFGLKLTKD